MLYRVHRGEESDMCSLSRWLDVLGRDKEKIWDSHKEYIKDFRGCDEFLQTVLDGYILGYLANSCDESTTASFLANISSEKAQRSIIGLSKRLLDFTTTTELLCQLPELRDRPSENLWLFMQHAMMYRFLVTAMRQGDPGRVINCLHYFTIWLQASNQHLYAAECLHLSACIKVYWSEGYKRFWMENCLINLSGKQNGFRACDAVCEHLIREIKAIVPHNVTETTLRYLFDKISPQIFFLRDVRRKMMIETGSPAVSMHSSKVSTFEDIRTVADELLATNMYQHVPNRRAEESVRVDLHGEGQTSLAFSDCIEKYKLSLGSDPEKEADFLREEAISIEGMVDYDSDDDLDREWIVRL
jgi:hypothetical protein